MIQMKLYGIFMIDISSLSSGLYLINIESEEKTQNLKLLKVGQ